MKKRHKIIRGVIHFKENLWFDNIILPSDVPLLRPQDVDYFPNIDDQERIRGWMKFIMGKMIAAYHGAFSNCGKFIE